MTFIGQSHQNRLKENAEKTDFKLTAWVLPIAVSIYREPFGSLLDLEYVVNVLQRHVFDYVDDGVQE